MGKVSLLDCTLRDGGYVNDWKFGHDNIVSIFERVVDAGTDIIEVGFLDDRRPYDYDRTIVPDTDCFGKIFGDLDRKQTKVVAMIDYGTCSLDHIKPCSESYIDGIRVIFKKHLRVEALQYVAELKKLGYMVFANLVSVTSYSDEELLDLVRLANEVKPDVISMVDTYGLTHQRDLLHILDILDHNLDDSISIAYHGHNNFQMGYANCIAVLGFSGQTERHILVDGSLFAMGKSAGNAPIELVAMHMNNEYGKHYHITQYLEAIDANIMQFYKPATWGYSLFFYIAAFNDCHPNYVKQLTNKRTLSIKQINELLNRLQGDKKLLYDETYMEKLYLEYQDQEINDAKDIKKLTDIFTAKNILIVGPGTSMETDEDNIKKYVAEKHPIIISINYVPFYLKPDYIFISNAKRYVQLSTALSRNKFKVIATSNVTTTNEPFDYVLNVSTLLDRKAQVVDNSLIMLLKVMIKTGVKKVMLAGFDGYSKHDNNYFVPSMEYEYIKQMADYLNQYTSEFIEKNKVQLSIYFLTKTRYCK